MRNLWMFLTATSVLLAGAAAAADPKIAVVDMSKLVQAHPDTAEADELLDKQAREFETEKEEQLGKFKAMRADFETARAEALNKALSESAREKKTDEAREKLIALEEFQQKIRETTRDRQRQLTDQRERMIRRIVGKIVEVINAYAGQNGYAIVLDTANRGLSGVESVIYADEKLDITDKILKLILETKDEE